MLTDQRRAPALTATPAGWAASCFPDKPSISYSCLKTGSELRRYLPHSPVVKRTICRMWELPVREGHSGDHAQQPPREPSRASRRTGTAGTGSQDGRPVIAHRREAGTRCSAGVSAVPTPGYRPRPSARRADPHKHDRPGATDQPPQHAGLVVQCHRRQAAWLTGRLITPPDPAPWLMTPVDVFTT